MNSKYWLMKHQWENILPDQIKLRTFSRYKTFHGLDQYIKLNLSMLERSIVAQFPLGILPFSEECARYFTGQDEGVENRHIQWAPPPPPVVPTYKWILIVYVQDVLIRLGEIKAKITSIFGKVLKLDSTTKVKWQAKMQFLQLKPYHMGGAATPLP